MSDIPVRDWAASSRVAAIHLLLSTLVVVAVAAVVLKVWYPAPLASATGMWAILMIVIIAAFISGPLLTLITYKKDKKAFVFDLMMIIMIQLVIFFYGVYSLAQARPVWITFYDNRFELVRLNDIEDTYLKNADDDYRDMSLTGPKWIAAKPVGSLNEIEDLKLWNRMGAKIAYRPDFYYAIKDAYPQIRAKAYDLSKLETANHKVAIDREVKAYPKAVSWLPLWAHEQHMVVLIDKDGIPLATVDLRPWTKAQMTTIITTTT